LKIVINRCFGGFSLSPAAEVELFEAGWREIGLPVAEYFGGRTEWIASELVKWREFVAGGMGASALFLTTFSKDETHCLRLPSGDATRADPRLVEIVGRMGEAANGSMAKLRVVEIPDGIEWVIDDYDGMESVKEAHREWR
jgi:hypothetical protein